MNNLIKLFNLNMKYLGALNGLRGFAFLQVIADHYIPTTCITEIGQFGVIMFFVLSSYLLTLQLYESYLEKNNMNVLNYFIKRFFRIYPCLTIALVFDCFIVGRITFNETWNVYLLTGLIDLYWAIYIEMRWYFIIPLVVFIFVKIKNLKLKFGLMIILTMISLYWHFYMNFIEENPTNIRSNKMEKFSLITNIIFLKYCPIFLIASFVAIAFYHLDKSGYKLQRFSFLQGVFIALMVTCHLAAIKYRCVVGYSAFYGVAFENYFLVYGFGYCIVVLLLNGNNFMTSFFELRVMIILGDISFPAYLFHIAIKEFAKKKLELYLGFYTLTSCFFISLIVSYIIHITYEVYFIKVSKNMCYFSSRKIAEQVPEKAGHKVFEETDLDNIDKDVYKKVEMSISSN